jgi:phosphoribosyl-AMP cyclohydrolase
MAKDIIAPFSLASVAWDAHGLVPVIAQDRHNLQVLMLAYANAEALALTLQTGYGYYYSRSRQGLWKKGESSGHLQHVQQVLLDCDGDAVLYLIEQVGPACHKLERSCFHNVLWERGIYE